MKGAFAVSMPALKATAAAGGDEWKETLNCLSKGVMTGEFTLLLESFSPRLSSSQARELASHVPLTCDGLSICNAEGENAGEGSIEGMIEWIGKAKTIKGLSCWDYKVGHRWWGGKDVGSRLAAALEASNHTASIEYFTMCDTDLVGSGIEKYDGIEGIEIGWC